MSEDIFSRYGALVAQAIERLQAQGGLPAGLALERVAVEPPRDPAHGDLAVNAALTLAKQAQRAPRALAEKLLPALRAIEGVRSGEVAGPGFINLRLEDHVWQQELPRILDAGESYGEQNLGGGRPVLIEYVSANPTGPLHVGHARGAVFGDALANLLQKTGWKVAREYYVNDAGAQIEALARSAALRAREALGETIKIADDLYPGDYLIPVGQTLARAQGKAFLKMSEDEQIRRARPAALAAMLKRIRADLRALNIRHDHFVHESELARAGKIEAAINRLTKAGLVYQGVLDPPRGKPPPEDWSPRPQPLFRASRFGDETDRPLQKPGGDWTYFAADIACHFDKIQRGFSRMINVWGADHAGYVKRLQAAVQALSGGQAELDVKLCHLIRLLRAGKPVKMSKRAGAYITLDALVREAGRDAVRFMMLTRRNDAPLDFDFEKVREQSQDNPVFYVQYAHARVRSLERRAAELGLPDNPRQADPALLADPAERSLLRCLARFPRQLAAAARAREPHRIAFFLHELAAAFHALWNKGKEDPQLRFLLPDNQNVSMARLQLIRATGIVLSAGLRILGVEPVEEMR